MPDDSSPASVNTSFTAAPLAPVQWALSRGLVPYEAAVAAMEARAAAIADGTGREMIWLLEHPPTYTIGTSGQDSDILGDTSTPIVRSGRGGQVTWHGPGQRVVYVMLDLRQRGRDVRAFVLSLERWIIAALERFNVKGAVRCGRVGVWVDRSAPGAFREDKIAAIGVRLRRWVSFHGIALNVEPDLSAFGGIVPCGITEPGLGVTSLVDLGLPVTMDDADDALKSAFSAQFGPVEDAEPLLQGA